MTPGETAFTRTGASSTASGPTIASSAPLSAARPDVPGSAAWAEPDLMVEQAYGVLWYRLLVSGTPLDRDSAERLAALLTRQADRRPSTVDEGARN
ncbi:TetR/AcrR family transcriptional regulator C-terminal ligand-binding domain-containing protein [Dactylosporangium matsuzakiense]|uniref:TetR/AcrR family transcriptional regulator C-terminal ligand-binding domain-containing protein n=1 Tax=Dactylosporangium matsuzakiense TaxID=53360 RepID=UPI0021C4BD83|nr:TetR/AcrR family transcriptional regulator C-terminal ligand-binding domain-containing protein [Dactylosporangium matsuzakiense]